MRILPDDILVTRSDARSLPDIDDLIATVRERLGTINLLFLNAGISRMMPVGTIDEDTFDDLVNVNFKGPFFTLRSHPPAGGSGGRWRERHHSDSPA